MIGRNTNTEVIMANVVNRTTKRYKRSVNTPDYPIQDWIINPDMSLVAGYQSKYWIITGDVITLMDETARSQADADEAFQAITSDRMQQKERLDGDRLLRAITVVVINEINILRAKAGLTERTANQFKNAIKTQVDIE